MTDDDRVFKVLADPTRRFLLDRLFERGGRTLTELESEGGDDALRRDEAPQGSRRRGSRRRSTLGPREAAFLNAVPIRLIHDRWIDKYNERRVSTLAKLKNELEQA